MLENYPEGQVEELEAVNNPEDAAAGTRDVPFSRELYIERDDFMEEPPKKFFRLAPGPRGAAALRLLHHVHGVVKDASGEVVELRCTYDPATRGGDAPDGRKVKATLHWVSAAHAVDAEVRLYDRLFTVENPEGAANKAGQTFVDLLNKSSLDVLGGCKLEPMLAMAVPGSRFQFERLGYFAADPDGHSGVPVFNRTVSLKDTWAKVAAREG